MGRFGPSEAVQKYELTFSMFENSFSLHLFQKNGGHWEEGTAFETQMEVIFFFCDSC
jgi:hypothetical protein